MKVYRIFKDETYYTRPLLKPYFIKRKRCFWWKTIVDPSDHRMRFNTFEEAEKYIQDIQKGVVLVKEIVIQ